MQIKFLSIASLALLFVAVSAAPPGSPAGPGTPAGPVGPTGGSIDEAAFNAKVAAIQNDPEIKNTLDFLIQQIAADLNGANEPAANQPGNSNVGLRPSV